MFEDFRNYRKLKITKKKKENTGSPIKLGMTEVLSFPRKRESRKYFFFKQIKGKKNGISFRIGKNKESKHWIPNQVGDDRSIVIPAKAGIQD
jgi:hypothetical protein